MRKAFILTLVAFSAIAANPLAARTTDAEVRGQMIRESLASYPGNCPCPYSTMRNGRSCGGRSAYSRPGGYAPLCYPADISDDMVRSYRQSHGFGN